MYSEASHGRSNFIGLDYDPDGSPSSCRSTCDMKFRGKQGQAFIGFVVVSVGNKELMREASAS